MIGRAFGSAPPELVAPSLKYLRQHALSHRNLPCCLMKWRPSELLRLYPLARASICRGRDRWLVLRLRVLVCLQFILLSMGFWHRIRAVC